ncbi:MAG: methionyl-tRNA formyltransferase [Bacteroidota bacterium]
MNKQLKILYMGTPDFAVAPLEKILETQHQLVGVVTAPDKPAGRGRKNKASAVKKFALENNLLVLQPTNLKSDEFQAKLNELQPDLIIVVAFRMLPKKVWSFPTYGTFNLHASLLPEYRGAAPIHWAIVNGEKKTGVTTFFIDEKIDTGEIILSKEIDISPEENVGSLHDKLMNLGATAITETIKMISSGNVQTHAQDKSKSFKPAPKLTKENTQINWNNSAQNIYNQIRGLSPFPTAWTSLRQNEEQFNCKIYSASKSEEKSTEKPGSIRIRNKKIEVATQDYYVIIESLKLEGKKKLASKDLLNGFEFSEKAYFV